MKLVTLPTFAMRYFHAAAILDGMWLTAVTDGLPAVSLHLISIASLA
jgi:hypothetical protein